MKAHYLVPALVVLFIVLMNPVFAQEPPVNEESVKKMEELGWMIGDWKQEGTWLPAGTKVESVFNCSWLFSKTIIRCEYFEPESPEDMILLSYYSYNLDLEHYENTAFGAGMGPFNGSFLKNGDSWTIQVAAINRQFKSWDQMIMTPKGDVVDIVQYRSSSGAVVEKVQEGTLTRID